MRRLTTKGKCALCGAVYSKAGMTKHLTKCALQHLASTTAGGRGQQRILHVTIEGSYAPLYWMHLAAPSTATLEDLDGFLRDLWLECCGHLSMFRIGGTDFYVDSTSARELGGRTMNVELGRVLAPGVKFDHEYDFGTTTELTLKVVSEWEEASRDKSVRILSQNDPPQIPCQSCGQPAAQVCVQCIYEDEGWLCDSCAADHECGEEMFLPVVNSPRVGMCAYTGDAYDE